MNDQQTGDTEKWRKLLLEGHSGLRMLRSISRRLPSEPRCKLCHNPFAGIGGKLFGIFGFVPSPKNPNLCQRCCDGPPGGAEVDIAILFADVRGSTSIAENMGSAEYAALMNRFYVAATRALIRHDAVVDKLIGDEVMALFIPGICGASYKRRAIDAARDLVTAVGEAAPELSIGVGVHSGIAFVGSVGGDVTDFTALGDAVNTAARLQGVVAEGEIAVTEAAFGEFSGEYPEAERRTAALRGKEETVELHVLRA